MLACVRVQEQSCVDNLDRAVVFSGFEQISDETDGLLSFPLPSGPNLNDTVSEWVSLGFDRFHRRNTHVDNDHLNLADD